MPLEGREARKRRSAVSNRTALAQLALVEHHGWSVEKIAQTWNQPVQHVRETLSELGMSPLPQPRQVPFLPATEEAAKERRDVIRLLYHQGSSVDELAHRFFYYSPELLQKIVKQSLETDKARTWGNHGLCKCGCLAKVRPGQRWAKPGCKKRFQRKSETMSK
jgi:hypothetical protein